MPNTWHQNMRGQKKKELQEETDDSSIIVGDFNTPLLEMDRSSKKKIILVHKKHLNKFKRIKITQCLLSHYNGIKLEISKRKTSRKSQIRVK